MCCLLLRVDVRGLFADCSCLAFWGLLLFAVCWRLLLFVGCCALCVVRCLRLLFIIRYGLRVACCLLSVVWYCCCLLSVGVWSYRSIVGGRCLVLFSDA